jgi:TIR domain
MPPQQSTPRVFISYSHDSPEHEARVAALAENLRGDGLTAAIDKDELFPSKGWPEWMRKQIEAARFVLVICTEKYRRRAEGDEEPGKGLGATFEGAIIDLDLYEAGGENRKFIPVLMREEDGAHRPKVLRRYSYFVMDRDYSKLVQLRSQGRPSRSRSGTFPRATTISPGATSTLRASAACSHRAGPRL